MKNQKNRFEYRENSQGIYDSLTGFIYSDGEDICEVLNQLNNKKDELAEDNYKFMMILRKYEINNLEKLDRILLEQRVW